MSDYAPGTTLRPVMVNVTFDEGNQMAHVGVGYHLVLPSGRVHEGGFTWHSPQGDYAHGPDEHIARLQAVMDELLRAAAEYEGAALSGPEMQVVRVPAPLDENEEDAHADNGK